MGKINLTTKQIEKINDIIGYVIEDERRYLEEMIATYEGNDVSSLTDSELYESYKDDTNVNNYIWFSTYELQTILETI
jgi:hypothetical protein